MLEDVHLLVEMLDLRHEVRNLTADIDKVAGDFHDEIIIERSRALRMRRHHRR